MPRGDRENWGGARSRPADAKPPGRKRQKTITYNGDEAVILRAGDEVCVIDATGPNIATVSIEGGMLKLINDQGKILTIVLEG